MVHSWYFVYCSSCKRTDFPKVSQRRTHRKQVWNSLSYRIKFYIKNPTSSSNNTLFIYFCHLQISKLESCMVFLHSFSCFPNYSGLCIHMQLLWINNATSRNYYLVEITQANEWRFLKYFLFNNSNLIFNDWWVLLSYISTENSFYWISYPNSVNNMLSLFHLVSQVGTAEGIYIYFN